MSDIDLKALRPDAVELHRQVVEFASGNRDLADLDLLAIAGGAALLLPLIDRLESAERRAEDAEKECAEQARVLGMGAERELALRAAMERQGRAAVSGMNAAKQNAAEMERNAIRLHAESSPVALASERAANAILTEEADALRKDAARYRFMRSEGLDTTAAKVERIATTAQFDAAIDLEMSRDAGAETANRNAGNGEDAGVEGGAELLDPNDYGQEVLRTFYTAWHGDRESPVADHVLVDIIFRDGSTAESITAGTYWWMARSYHDDIIAWRPAMAQEGGK